MGLLGDDTDDETVFEPVTANSTEIIGYIEDEGGRRLTRIDLNEIDKIRFEEVDRVK